MSSRREGEGHKGPSGEGHSLCLDKVGSLGGVAFVKLLDGYPYSVCFAQKIFPRKTQANVEVWLGQCRLKCSGMVHQDVCHFPLKCIKE